MSITATPGVVQSDALKEIYGRFAEASPVLIAISALAYFLKVWMGKNQKR